MRANSNNRGSNKFNKRQGKGGGVNAVVFLSEKLRKNTESPSLWGTTMASGILFVAADVGLMECLVVAIRRDADLLGER